MRPFLPAGLPDVQGPGEDGLQLSPGDHRALTAYALWNVVNWFDAIVLDCLWFCHDKHFVIKGTEDMEKDSL